MHGFARVLFDMRARDTKAFQLPFDWPPPLIALAAQNLYLAVLGSVVAYTAYNYAQAKLSARKVSSYAYVNPVIAVFTGALFLHEPVTPRMIAAMGIIMGGVALTNQA